jgi:hypothetical protein
MGSDWPDITKKADLGAGQGFGRGLEGGLEARGSFGVDERQAGETK